MASLPQHDVGGSCPRIIHNAEQLPGFEHPANSPDDSGSQKPWQELLENLLACTGATGAVVLLRSQNTLYCRATAGVPVPELGTRLEQRSGITVLCFHTGQNFICEDTELDRRVNTQACRVLGIRSVLAVALKKVDLVVGVLELFSGEPQAFGNRQVVLVSTFTGELLRLAVQDLAVAECQDQNSYAVNNPVKPNEFSSTREKEKRAELANLPGVSLVKFGQNSTSSRLPMLIAATVTLAALVVWVLQLPSPWRSRFWQSKSPSLPPVVSRASTPSRPGSKSVPQNPEVVSVLSADTGDVAAKIKAHTSSTSTNWDTLQHSADSHDPRAEYELALRYATGDGVRQDYNRAMSWFARAAAAGNPSAQWKIGLGYLKGIGVQQDDRKAADWFKRAANQAHIGAQFVLSEMYLNGRGVPVDYVRAYTWAAISLSTSNQGEQELRNIESLLTPSELQQAKSRIRLWWGRHANSAVR